MQAKTKDFMILIADSGSTKTDWALVGVNGSVEYYRTGGLNPVLQSLEDVEREVSLLLGGLPAGCFLESVYFYGAGCVAGQADAMERMLRSAFGFSRSGGEVCVYSDLLAAARSLCGRDTGIACILGTGANSCLYDGERILANTPPLGFILGDEGSGAWLGRRFLNGIFKGWLPREMREEFLAECGMTYSEIIERVYRRPLPNRFLAGLVPFLASRLSDEHIRRMVAEGFREFLRLNVRPYGYPELPVSFTGGVASCFEGLLREAVCAEGFTMGTIRQSPIEGLVAYHARIPD